MLKEFFKGIWKENPVLRQLLGMCPTLAVTTSSVNGIAMGLATTFVVVSSGIIVSLFRNVIPSQVRIPVFTVIIATFVTLVDLILKAYFPDISRALGPYVPLIVVNCIILGRQEAFTSKNPVLLSVCDTLGMGLGFTLLLVVLGSIREILGSGSVFGMHIMPAFFRPLVIMVLPAGAFITLGLIAAMYNLVNQKADRT
ncbi:MAG: electron transport complex subunit E [Elusimicrobia bacterium]|nr:electron transport complex subunit E [Elusimicrobiota bacterium]